MEERRAARLAAALAEQGGELEPPWARFPWISRYSIGWRMGMGESYSMLWSDFAEKITTPDEALAYLRRHPPAPRTWADTVAHWLGQIERDQAEADERDADDDEDLDDDDDLYDEDLDDDDADFDDEDHEEMQDTADEVHWIPILLRERLVIDDAAYPVFVRNARAANPTGHLPAPWADDDESTPESALRYSARELGWWARWLFEERIDFSAYLATQPSPPEAWQPVVESISSQPSSAAPVSSTLWRTLDGGAVSLLPAMVQLGALPPPWLGDHPPIADIEWEDDSDDRHRWAWWVFDTFEDTASWRAYLERWPPPPAWRDALQGYLFTNLSEE